MTHRHFALVLGLTSGLSLADSTKPVNPGSGSTGNPRVLVVFDTSTSMSQVPDFATTNLAYDDDTAYPNPSMTPVGACRSKFCIAKKTVYETLKTYVENASVQLGLATYYQYLIRYEPTSASRCWYDAMWKAGQTMYYPRDGSYGVAEGSRFASTSNVNLSSSNAAVSSSYSNQYSCANDGGVSQYNLTEQQSTTGTLRTCLIYNQRTAPAGGTYTLPASGLPSLNQCDPSMTYSASFDSFDDNGGNYYHWRVPATSSCPAAVPVSLDYTGATTLTVGSSNRSSCSGTNTGCWESGYRPWVSTYSDSCTSTMPCYMYSAATGAESTTTSFVEWIAFFGGDCTGGSQPTAANPADNSFVPGACARILVGGSYQSPTTGVPGFYDSSRVDGTVGTTTSTFTNQADCHGLDAGVETRISDGVTPVTTFTNRSSNQLKASAGGVTGGYTSYTNPPGRNNTTSSVRCSSTWPCDVTLTNMTPNSNSNTVTVNSCTASAGPPVVTCSYHSPTALQLLRTGASCPSFSPGLTSNPSGYWPTSPNCGGGTSACTLTASGTPTTTVTMPGCNTSPTTW